ncbi:acyl-CoA dehydrogenase family protein [Antarctobacter sp.]|uniref:acyl-CoA dehydrogenase family protein n=1 Tax=Antarctobacter sp. TaxID=1872577 RepID=UPI003A8CBF7F
MDAAILDGALASAEEQAMIRDSARGFLERHWAGAQPGAGPDLNRLWQDFCGLGLGMLGGDPDIGGIAEAMIVIEELGRAACPLPMAAALLANLALTGVDGASDLLEHVQSGAILPAFVWTDLGGDRGGGRLEHMQDRVTGRALFVENVRAATHFIVVLPGERIAVVAAGPDTAVAPDRAMGGDLLGTVTFDAAQAQVFAARTSLADLQLIDRLAAMARAHGAARRAFDLAVDWAKERHQFGQPIGKFQAVQHKLADILIDLEGVRLTLHHAAAMMARGHEDRAFYALACFANGASVLRRASLQTHHVMGAIGYAEEHEAPRHFKRIHVDCLRHGGPDKARAMLGTMFLGHEVDLPRYDLGDVGNAFRKEVRAWLDDFWTGDRKAAYLARPFRQREYDADFARELGKTGWIGMNWPAASGGQDRGPWEQLAFVEEMERAEAPRFGASVQAAMLMLYGTPGQQARYLPEILRGEAMHGMGYSEPNAGSDLAALRTRAVRDGDEWVITGEKIWTTTYWGQYMFLAARTDAGAQPKHAGISMFIVPMDTPGITVNPATTMYDGTFANIFYQDVRLPADALLGPLNGGWKVLTSALANERGYIGGGITLKVVHAFNQLCRYLRQADDRLAGDPVVRLRLGQMAAEIEVGRQMMVHCASMIDAGETPMHDAAISKVYAGELMERFGETALDILGLCATLSEQSDNAILGGRIEQNLRHSLMWVISIGTNEIQRNLIATKGLGLPR